MKCVIFKDVIQWMARCGCRYICFHFRGEFDSVDSFFVITPNIFTSTIKKPEFSLITFTLLMSCCFGSCCISFFVRLEAFVPSWVIKHVK